VRVRIDAEVEAVLRRGAGRVKEALRRAGRGA